MKTHNTRTSFKRITTEGSGVPFYRGKNGKGGSTVMKMHIVKMDAPERTPTK